MITLELGAKVRWTSQSGGYESTKEGHVEAEVPAGQIPERANFPNLFLGAGPGRARNHKSYVVLVKMPVGWKAYWPRVSQLQHAEEPFKFRPEHDHDYSGQTNAKRAERAYRACQKYDKGEGEPMEFIVKDLLTDLMHLCDEQGLNFRDLLTKSMANHGDER